MTDHNPAQPISDERLALEAADAIGVTPLSDIRPFVVQGVLHALGRLRASQQPVSVPDELRTLSDAATPGPWAEDESDLGTIFGYLESDEFRPIAKCFGNFQDWSANTDFIVSAVNFVRSLLSTSPQPPTAAAEQKPAAWVIPGLDNARDDGSIDAKAWQEGEFSKPLYASPPSVSREAVRVQELEWSGGDGALWFGNHGVHLMRGYCVSRNNRAWCYQGQNGMQFFTDEGVSAKAAAQADFETRIRSPLIPSTDAGTREDGLRETIDALDHAELTLTAARDHLESTIRDGSRAMGIRQSLEKIKSARKALIPPHGDSAEGR